MTFMDKLLAFVASLEDKRASYIMGVARTEAVMVTVVVPGERIEVEFFADGTVEVERFISAGDVDAAGEDDLAEIIGYLE